MGLRVHANLDSLRVRRALSVTSDELAVHMRRLASGLRVVSAADDAAALSMAERMRARTRSLGAAERNAGAGIDLLRTAESGLSELTDLFIRARELWVQSLNGTLSAEDRAALAREREDIAREVMRLVHETDFAGLQLFDAERKISIQVGVDAGETIDIHLRDLRFLFDAFETSDPPDEIPPLPHGDPAPGQLSLDDCIDFLSRYRGELGAEQRRLESAHREIAASREAGIATESRIRDADFATEVASLARLDILRRMAVSVLVQANLQPAVALELLTTLPDPMIVEAYRSPDSPDESERFPWLVGHDARRSSS